MIVLDTHALLWMDRDDAQLGATARAAILEAYREGRLAVSAITFWECALLEAERRISLPTSIERWRMELLGAGLLEVPLDGSIAIAATRLVLPHRDPADRFIAATAIAHDARLVTADARLLAGCPGLQTVAARG